jgi:hypothetical protein
VVALLKAWSFAFFHKLSARAHARLASWFHLEEFFCFPRRKSATVTVREFSSERAIVYGGGDDDRVLHKETHDGSAR